MVASSQLFIMCPSSHSASAPWLVWRLVQQNEPARFICGLRTKQCHSLHCTASSLWTTPTHCPLLEMHFNQHSSLLEVSDVKTVWRQKCLDKEESRKLPKGHMKVYLIICSLYTLWAIAKAGGEMADGLESYFNAFSLSHQKGNSLCLHRALLLCAIVRTGQLSPALLEMQYFCKWHWQKYFHVLLLVIGIGSENSSSFKTCICSCPFLIPSKNPKGTLNTTLDSGTEMSCNVTHMPVK